ncbi:hypothetical protein HOC01_03045 [archaeon]|jgi:hypothetical protein|nr:hypothetical protein [archaeon]MBT6698133.1 hypothetical protein [archaeon]
MALAVIDKRYGEATKTTHDLILLVLAKEYPLTIGQITKRIKVSFKVKITFQAIRKSLNILVGRKVLKVLGQNYQIDKNYVTELKRLSDQLMTNYYPGEDKTQKSIPKEQVHSEFIFDNLIQADQYWSEVVLHWAYNLKEEDDHRFFFHGPHCWYVFGHLGLESEFLLKLNSLGVKSYYLIENDTLLDRWTKQFYEDHKVKYITKKNGSTEMKTALGVFGNSIIQYDYPEELNKSINNFYNSSKKVSSINLTKIAHALKFKVKLKLFVMKNNIIANKIKREIITNF